MNEADLTLTRDHAQALLQLLDQLLPALIADNPDDADFWPAFAGEADVILDGVGPEDHEWASKAIDELLTKHGKEHGQH
jgi:hypothetical protein